MAHARHMENPNPKPSPTGGAAATRGSHVRQNMGFHTAGLARPAHVWAEERPSCQSVPQIHTGKGGCASLLPNPLKPHSLYVLLSVTTTLCQLCRGKCSAQHWWLIRSFQEMPLPSGSLSAWWGTGRAADAGLGLSSYMG